MSSCPVHNLTLSEDAQFSQYEAAATLGDQQEQTLISILH